MPNGTADPESIQRMIREFTRLREVLGSTSAAGQVLTNLFNTLITDISQRFPENWIQLLADDFNATTINLEALVREEQRFKEQTQQAADSARQHASAERDRAGALSESEQQLARLTQAALTPVGTEAGAGLGGVSQQAQTAATFIEDLTQRLRDAGIPAREIQRIIDKVNELGVTFQRVLGQPTLGVQTEEGIRRLSLTLEDAGGTAHRFSDQINTAADRVEYFQRRSLGASDNLKFTGEELTKLEQQFPRAFERASELGFGVQRLQTATTEASTGISKLVFGMRNADGVTERLTLHVDRLGSVLRDSQKRFRTFGGEVVRNFFEVLKWTIAVQAIYAPMRRLQELIETAIQNETELANAAVVVGKAHADLDQIFDVAAQAAAQTGESISGVLQGYTQAFRATGAIRDQTERAAVAQQLLVDSLVLSKLSTLEQAEAMDTLVGALTQTGRGLDESQELLDQWVATSRAANVSVETLAESFAITATAADNAGLSAQELNAVIAIIAETTTLSATEVGNAGRAFIQGFQSDAAREQLARFGIAVEDAAGQTRGFLDIAFEVRALFDAGLITQNQLQQIATAIGGRGARRAAQVQAFLNNLGRIEEITASQANAAGQAQDALAIKLDTVQTKLTEVANAFQNLAQTMGSEGGIIDAFKVTLDIVEFLINKLSGLTELLGGATAPLAIGAGILAYLNAYDRLPGLVGGIAGRAGGLAQRAQFGLGVRGGIGPGATTTAMTQQWTRGAEGQVLVGAGGRIASGIQRHAGLIGVGIAEAFMLGINVREGDWDGVAGQVSGGIIGGLLTGFTPIGILLGSTAGEALFNYLTDIPPQAWEDVFEPAEPFFRRDREDAPDVDDIQTEEQAYQELFKTIGGGFEGIGRFRANLRSFATRLTLPEEAQTPRAAAFAILAGQDEAEINRIIKIFQELRHEQALLQEGFTDPTISNVLIERTRQVAETNASVIIDVQTRIAQSLRESLAEGTLSAKEFREQSEFLETFGISISKTFLALGNNFENAADAYNSLGDVIVGLTGDQRRELNSLVNEYLELEQAILELGPAYSIMQAESQAALQMQFETLGTVLNAYYEGLRRAQLEAQIQLPSVQVFEDFDASEMALIIARAYELQADYIKETIALGLQPEGVAFEDVKNQYDDFFYSIGDSGSIQLAESLGKEFVSRAKEQLLEAGDILSDVEFRLQPFLDISAGELPGLLQQYQALVANLQQQFASFGISWEPDEQTFGAILKDFVAVPITADLQILNLLMQENNELQQKQLDGIYNLPAGASFFVPLQAAKLFPQEGAGGFDLSALETLGQQELGLDQERNRILADMKQTLKEPLLEPDIPDPEVTTLADAFGEIPQTLEEFLGRQRLGPFQGFQGGTVDELQEYWRELAEQGLTRPGQYAPGMGPQEYTGPLQEPTLAERLEALFTGLFTRLETIFGYGEATPRLFTPGAPFYQDSQNGVDTTPPTNLQLDINQSTNLVVDGRVLAQVLSHHLFEQLIRSEGSRGGTIRLSVLG